MPSSLLPVTVRVPEPARISGIFLANSAAPWSAAVPSVTVLEEPLVVSTISRAPVVATTALPALLVIEAPSRTRRTTSLVPAATFTWPARLPDRT